MMYPYPFFGFPNYRRYYKAPFPQNANYMHNTNDNLNLNQNMNTNINRNSYNSSFRNKTQNNNENNYNNANQYPLNTNLRNNTSASQNLDSDEEFFDFFGIKLAFDDLLIIALLFFLYKEEAKDPYLYISLILLLLS